MLGGLLCALLTGRRWGWFARAIESRLHCSATLALTGNRKTDGALSAVLNRYACPTPRSVSAVAVAYASAGPYAEADTGKKDTGKKDKK